MRKPKDIDDLTSRLQEAAATPLALPGSSAPTPAAPRAPAAALSRIQIAPIQGRGKDVFLRVPNDLFAKLDALAVAKTRETGRGVNVQKVILSILADAV